MKPVAYEVTRMLTELAISAMDFSLLQALGISVEALKIDPINKEAISVVMQILLGKRFERQLRKVKRRILGSS